MYMYVHMFVFEFHFVRASSLSVLLSATPNPTLSMLCILVYLIHHQLCLSSIPSPLTPTPVFSADQATDPLVSHGKIVIRVEDTVSHQLEVPYEANILQG